MTTAFLSSPRWVLRAAAVCGAFAVMTGCAPLQHAAPLQPLKHTLWGVTADHQLIRVQAAQPEQVVERKPLVGLPAGETVVGIDFRVARGVLFAVTSVGRLYTVDTATGALRAVSMTGSEPVVLQGQSFGIDFNPAADRIRVVSDAAQNLRLHPDTGALVDFDAKQPGVQPDPNLAFASGDANAGRTPQVMGAAYTYNKKDDKLTTNYAIDAALGALLTQGTVEGRQPVVSPNSGRLYTVGRLGLGPLQTVGFDIADVDNVALAAVTTVREPRTQLYRIDLTNGQARRVGQMADGAVLRGLAIEP